MVGEPGGEDHRLHHQLPEEVGPCAHKKGRTHVHAEMSYCDFKGFKMLAGNNLGWRATHCLGR